MTKEKTKEIYNKILKFIYVFCGLFGFVAYVSYLIKLIFWPSNKLELIAAFLGIAVAGIPVFFRRFFEKKLPKKLFKVLESIFAYGMLFYFITFLCLSSFILGAGALQSDADELSEDCVFIVYGAGLKGDQPGVTLRKRLDKTVEYMEELPDSVCIVSGGQGPDEVLPEAEVMKNYLVEKGIAKERIFLEDKSRNTIQNIKNSYKIIEDEGLNGDCIVSISNAFHIPRIELIFSRLGIESEFVLAPDPNPYSMFSVLVREYMSYAKLLIFGTE
ncbi:MAG: YdcF family protein [Ruminococcaceae bacterium]|nr:YdcF family protein [Oscillospiraceae bacterium]